MNDLAFHPVTVKRWLDLAAFFEQHGNPNYCWPKRTRWRLKSAEFRQLNSGQRRDRLQRLVEQNVPVGIQGYRRGRAV